MIDIRFSQPIGGSFDLIAYRNGRHVVASAPTVEPCIAAARLLFGVDALREYLRFERRFPRPWPNPVLDAIAKAVST